MQIISSLADLDLQLAECDSASAISDDALRKVFASFRMDFSTSIPEDPFSAEYSGFQMDFYRHLSGKSYKPENEISEINVEEGARIPFPFSTGSTATAGDHLIALGFVLGKINLPRGAKIIEFGAGWGNTSIALASLGYDVTVVDIERRFCELIRRRAETLQLKINVIHGDFFQAENISDPFDAALFYECFHHCSDHIRMLRALRVAVKPHGRVYFACEPILDEFPVPWGIRTDGESLWAARSNGWLELGFQTEYFMKALALTGWTAEKYASNDVGWATVWEARRTDAEIIHKFDVSDDRIQTQIGAKKNGVIEVKNSGGGFALFGPHIHLDAGEWRVRFNLLPNSTRRGKIVMDACSGFGAIKLGTHTFELGAPNSIELKINLDSSGDAVEARLFCDSAITISIESLEFIREDRRLESPSPA